MDIEVLKILREGARVFDVQLDDQSVEKLFNYMQQIIQWNKKFNLTAIDDEKDFIIKHFLDSLSIVPIIDEIKNGRNIIDIGTGAGFPSIPVKIVRDGTNFTLIDSVGKKIGFIDHCIDTLLLNGVKAYHERAEDFARKKEHREKYDIAVARAVASLPVLLEYCLPFLKDGGIFIAMKGRFPEDEITGSQRALKILKARIIDVREVQLPFSDIMRNIVIVEKYGKIDGRYPRKSGKPSSEPLI